MDVVDEMDNRSDLSISSTLSILCNERNSYLINSPYARVEAWPQTSPKDRLDF